MADREADGNASRSAWEAFWRRTSESAALRRGGPLDVVLARFWGNLFGEFRETGQRLRVLDFACGNGAVTQFAMATLGTVGRAEPLLVGLDTSTAAAVTFRTRFPAAKTVVADAVRTPFADASFDLVASQFGLEYAGMAAVGEAARLVAPGGILAAVLHRREGAIHRECAANLHAVARVRDSGLLAHAKEVFRRGAAAASGKGSKGAFREADRRLALAVGETEGVLRQFGDTVAGGTLARLYADLAHMYRRIGAHDPLEVADWADRMMIEMDAYAGRMSGMLAAALDPAQFEAVASRMGNSGLALRVREELKVGPGKGEPGAWLLVGERPAADR